ncbi:MAG: hypothetical protein OEW84_01845 [Aigarchaeota archaeon]|nr:hypothetical protein [Aigarchaeota archaeon]
MRSRWIMIGLLGLCFIVLGVAVAWLWGQPEDNVQSFIAKYNELIPFVEAARRRVNLMFEAYDAQGQQLTNTSVIAFTHKAEAIIPDLETVSNLIPLLRAEMSNSLRTKSAKDYGERVVEGLERWATHTRSAIDQFLLALGSYREYLATGSLDTKADGDTHMQSVRSELSASRAAEEDVATLLSKLQSL